MSRRRPRFDAEHPPVRDGARLHREVPAERWCVKMRDLQELRALLGRYVAEGRVVPTERDPFSASDDQVGPCIHTLNSQLIVPITRRAGNPSWALMLRPDGRLCDVFVTHGWEEGAYEFIDKVCNSWPSKARHAYCCMLSNPQCLDIGNLLTTPRESPFARALFAAPCMLVVPNRKSSIYGRIWCVYEAFLAYSESKTILTASAPLPHLKRHMAVMVSIFLAAAGATMAAMRAGALPPVDAEDVDAYVHAAAYALLVVAANIRPSPWTRAILVMIAVGAGYEFALFAHLAVFARLSAPTKAAGMWRANSLVWKALASGLVSTIAEVDRLAEIQNREEAEQLRNGYTGSVMDASSSVPEDKQKILGELAASGLEQEVDEAIEVLLVAGVCTPALRSTFQRAGALQHAGRIKWSLAIFAWANWFALICDWLRYHVLACRILLDCSRDTHPRSCVMGFAELVDHLCIDVDSVSYGSVRRCFGLWCNAAYADPDFYISWFGVFAILGWLLLCLRIPRDSQSFAVRTFVCAYSSAYLCVWLDLAEKDAWANIAWRISAVGFAPAMLALSAAGPEWVAGIPGLGPCLVRCLMWQLPCHSSTVAMRIGRPVDDTSQSSETESSDQNFESSDQHPESSDRNVGNEMAALTWPR